MPHRTIPATATAAGSPLSGLLARALRDNILAMDHSRQACDAMLDEDTGHKHTAATRTLEYTFSDRVSPKTGISDKVPFRFGGGIAEVASYTATVTNSVRTHPNMAAHLTNMMRNEVYAAYPAFGSAASVPILVTYDSTEGSSRRGRFLFQHTGETDSPEPRVFELLFLTGTGADACVGPIIGFAKRDRKKAYGYVGGSGFLHGFPIDQITIREGGKLGTSSFVDGAFTSRTFSNNIVTADAIATGAVTGPKIIDGSVTGPKLGAPQQPTSPVSPTNISSGGSQDFLFVLPGRGSSDTPQVSMFSTTGAVPNGSLSWTVAEDGTAGGGAWRYIATVTNHGPSTVNAIWGTAY